MRLLVYAGPNGSGKSSLRDSQAEADKVDLTIDPDRIARSINPANPRSVDREAASTSLRMFEAGLANRQTMSLETTLSGHTILRRLLRARSEGYRLKLRYVSLENAEINVERVWTRAALGGHDIAPDDVRRRYASSLANLPKVLKIVHQATLTDNSGAAPRPVLEMVDQRIVRMARDLPPWLAPLMPLIGAAGLDTRFD